MARPTSILYFPQPCLDHHIVFRLLGLVTDAKKTKMKRMLVALVLGITQWSGSAMATMDLTTTTMSATLGPYNVTMRTTQLINGALDDPFAPTTAEPRILGLSIFYPAATNETIETHYFPQSTAAEEPQEFGGMGLNVTTEGLLSLCISLAAPNTSIASPPTNNSSAWPVLLFSPAFGSNRFLYPSLLRQISSYGFVVVAFDTAYDTDIFTLANGTVIPGNSSSYMMTEEAASVSAATRAQDASFIIDHLGGNISSLISACGGKCLNTTQVGMFGHSIGGAATASAMLNDTRIIGGIGKSNPFPQTVSKNVTISPFFSILPPADY